MFTGHEHNLKRLGTHMFDIGCVELQVLTVGLFEVLHKLHRALGIHQGRGINSGCQNRASELLAAPSFLEGAAIISDAEKLIINLALEG